MKQKLLLAVVVLGLVVLIVGCGGKYSDVKKVNQEFIDVMKVYVDDLAGVASAADAARVINKLADGMEPLVPKMKAMKAKYPELQDPENLPEEIRATETEMASIGQKFAESFMKLIPYMAEKEVQAAQTRLASIMSSLGE